MARSGRLVQLERRLADIRRTMLPRRFSGTGIYSSRTIDHTRGYLLLAHAEIEAYLEDISRTIMEDAADRWKRTGTATKRTIGAVVEVTVARAVESHRDRLTNNHGIKDKNLIRIFEPLGVDVGAIDTVWLAAMTSFGGLRGVVAHTSSIGATTLPDPMDALKLVKDLVTGLRKIDEVAQKLLR